MKIAWTEGELANSRRLLPGRCANLECCSHGPLGLPLPWVRSSTRRHVGTSAGIDGLTLHGLRRSFKSLTEWLEVPARVVAQIMGHKPSATAEKHYTVRPLDLLRVHHEKIEAWILEQAGIAFDAQAVPGALRVVNA